MNDLIEERLKKIRDREDDKKKFPPDFPDGEQIASGVYDQGNGMIIVGDKY